MTPDLMRAGAVARRAAEERAAAPRRRPARAAARRATRASSARGELDIAHGAILYLDDITVSFDGFKALNALSLCDQRRRDALHHRPERRRQDDDDGRHHRQDPARRRPAFFGSTIDLLRLRENEIASIGIGRKFQKPTVFEHLSVFENLELALKADRGVRASLFFRLSGEQLDRIGEMLVLIHLKDHAQRTAGAALARPEAVARDRHAADAEPDACCCSTSRSPA